jgi:protein-S-isoprenylcysteine O-methyltransferase Ste14
MSGEPSQIQHSQHDPDTVRRLGAWLFQRRTLVPLPIVVALLLLPAGEARPFVPWLGVVLVAAGELVRLWAVRQIGVISRTRSDRVGPLVTTGPFAMVRNPLYLGNIGLWLGLSLSARLTALAPFVLLMLGLTYHAIVRWEERLLESKFGEPYRVYAARVPRWWPRFPSRSREVLDPQRARFSWGETLYSERGTLIAIAIGYGLLYLKQRG